MRGRKEIKYFRLATAMMLFLGVGLVAASAFYASSFLAIVGLALVFWSAILFYVAPDKHVPLTLFNASAEAITSNIERALIELNLTEKGIYLPPENLPDIDSSLIFVPAFRNASLPTVEELTEKLYAKHKNGVLLTPPGLEMCRLFERELGISFTKTNLAYLKVTLPKLLVDNLELAETLEVKTAGNIIIVDITGTLFSGLCQQTNNHVRAHDQVGCLLTSAIACALAKSVGQPIIIQSETQYPTDKAIHIEYNIGTPVLVTDTEGIPKIFAKQPLIHIIPAQSPPQPTPTIAPTEEPPPPKDAPIPVIKINQDTTTPQTVNEQPKITIIQPPPAPVIIIDPEHLKKDNPQENNQTVPIIAEPAQAEPRPVTTETVPAEPAQDRPETSTVPTETTLPLPGLPLTPDEEKEPVKEKTTEASPALEPTEAKAAAPEPETKAPQIAEPPQPTAAAPEKVEIIPDDFDIPSTSTEKAPDAAQTQLPPPAPAEPSSTHDGLEFPGAILKSSTQTVPATKKSKKHNTAVIVQKEVTLTQNNQGSEAQKSDENNNTEQNAKE